MLLITPPKEIRLKFNDPIEVTFTHVKVVDASGRKFPNGDDAAGSVRYERRDRAAAASWQHRTTFPRFRRTKFPHPVAVPMLSRTVTVRP